MIIKKIVIQNYMCYYGEKTFEFNDGLNIILGENGEGKTKFFEALVWLFEGNLHNQVNLVSKKALAETKVGESIVVGVSMVSKSELLESENTIYRSFRVKKGEKENENIAYNNSFEGKTYNLITGEREDIDGKSLMKIVFPHRIRKYSMFKGESAINIFKDIKTLQELISINSHAKYYEPYAKVIEKITYHSDKTISTETKNSARGNRKYKNLEKDLEELKRKLHETKDFLRFSEEEIEKTNEELNLIRKNINNAKELKVINNKINNIERKKEKIRSRINEDYTTKLFDDKWILIHFAEIQEDFSKKIKAIDKERRSLADKHKKKVWTEEGKKEGKIELLKDVVALPYYAPSKQHMEEMLEEMICKVCNREVEENSPSHHFMKQKLKEYLDKHSKTITSNSKEKPSLFSKEFIRDIFYINKRQQEELSTITRIKEEIVEEVQYNNARKKEIKELNEKIEKEKEDRSRVLSGSNLKDSELIDNLDNYDRWQESLLKNRGLTTDYNSQIKKLKSEIEVKEKEKRGISIKSVSQFYIDTNDILNDIETIFKDTKEQKFNEFIQKLEDKSNQVFKQINAFSFIGVIKFERFISNKIKIRLQEKNGRPFLNPNQSLETSMYLSIIFAISELTKEARDESFPLIFDAPTSSFGETKKAEFLDLIYNTSGQKILLIKDFLIKDGDNITIKKEFERIKRNKALWVRLKRKFDPMKLETINSQVISI